MAFDVEFVDSLKLLKQINELNINVKAIFLITGYADYSEKILRDYGMTRLLKKHNDIGTVIDFIIKEKFLNKKKKVNSYLLFN